MGEVNDPLGVKMEQTFQTLSGVWALLVSIVLIVLGNDMHFTLTGLSGGTEWVSAAELAVVTSGYFRGFLSGARFTPVSIKRAGHVRDFAVLGSFMSAGLMAFTLLAELWQWTPLRVLVGYCDPDLQDECGEGPGPAQRRHFCRAAMVEGFCRSPNRC